MEQNNNNNNLGDKVVSDLQKDFVAVGKHHVHGWYAWAIVGIVLGMAVGIAYVANQSFKFEPSSADAGDIKVINDSAPQWPGHSLMKSMSWGSVGHEVEKSRASWPNMHSGSNSTGWTGDPDEDGDPTEHDTNISATWPANHTDSTSDTWPSGHTIMTSKQWPADHAGKQSSQWPNNHKTVQSSTWPEDHNTTRSSQWPADHTASISMTWPEDHIKEVSARWPADHKIAKSLEDEDARSGSTPVKIDTGTNVR